MNKSRKEESHRNLDPLEHGWVKIWNYLKPVWFDGLSLPPIVYTATDLDNIESEDNNDSDGEIWSDNSDTF